MPENEFSSRNSGRDEDAAQNHKHLDEMTTDELKDALSDMWDTMDETSFDPAQMDAYLSELEKREPIMPDFDVDASLAAFHEKHARLFEQVPPVQISTVAKPVYRRRWCTSLVAAIVAVVMMLCSMVTAQAFGFDVFGTIARWTEETFKFSIIAQPSDNRENTPAPKSDGDFATLQEALDAYSISQLVAPQWYPAGLETVKLAVFPRNTGITIQAIYATKEISITISIRQYATAGDAQLGIGTFEKDSDAVTLYERNDITHYILSNNSDYIATWANDMLVCSISGNLTVDELKLMIDSIYKG